MPVTLQDVAVRAGVSKSAVSRTFTPGASVSPKTRAKVEQAAAELGYRTNFLASSLTTGRTKLIGLISDNFTNPFFLEIFDQFTRALQAAELRPLLINLSAAEDANAALTMLQQYSVDGVIVASSTLPQRFAETFRQAGLPVVHAFGWSAQAAGGSVVGIDNVAAGRFAAETLLNRGYTRIGFLGGPEQAATTQDRLAGFQARLAGTGVTPVIRFARDYAYQAGADAMVQHMSDPVDAWFCGDDVIAIGALDALKAAGRDVPGHMGLLGLNDMAMAGWQGINLTTIRQPADDIVATAVDLVQQGVSTPETAPERRLLSFELVERGTLRPKP